MLPTEDTKSCNNWLMKLRTIYFLSQLHLTSNLCHSNYLTNSWTVPDHDVILQSLQNTVKACSVTLPSLKSINRWITFESWIHSLYIYLLWLSTRCVVERGPIILCAEWKISLWIFPRVQFWFGNYVYIMFSALTNGVLQVPAQGWLWTHFF